MREIKVALASLAILIACATSVCALTAEDAVQMAVEAEEKLPDLVTEIGAMKETIVPTESVQTIDGVEYRVVDYLDPVTGKILRMIYDDSGRLIRSDFSDPETGITLTTQYDESGNEVSQTIMTTSEDGSVWRATTIQYNADGTKTYIMIDYTESADNKITATVVAGGDIRNPDDIIEMTLETQPGMPRPPVESTCPNTGQSEIVV
jgi:YD repeat-containing protein